MDVNGTNKLCHPKSEAIFRTLVFTSLKKNPTRCNSISKFYYFIFIWSSTCFGRHAAHHQEPKTALAPSGFPYCIKMHGSKNIKHVFTFLSRSIRTGRSGFRFPAARREFSFQSNVTTGFGAHSAFFPMGTCVLSPGGKSDGA